MSTDKTIEPWEWAWMEYIQGSVSFDCPPEDRHFEESREAWFRLGYESVKKHPGRAGKDLYIAMQSNKWHLCWLAFAAGHTSGKKALTPEPE